MLLIHHPMGWALQYIFSSVLDDRFMDFQMYPYDQLNVRPWCNLEALSLADLVKLRPNSSYMVCWYKAFPVCSCDIILIFLSDSSLVVSAGLLHTVSVVLFDTPYIDRTWPPYWFPQEIYVEHFVSLVKCHTMEHNFPPSQWLRPSLLLSDTPEHSPLASSMCGPQPYTGLPGYHFLSHPLTKNGGVFFLWTNIVPFLKEI